MTLVKFDQKYRRIWMFPRNIRKIYPWKMAQVCQLIQELTASEEWSGNQDLQNSFSEGLERANLKAGGEKVDAHSGGARTYVSQLECLGLVYKHEDTVKFTLAGKSLIDMEEPLTVLQTQLLNHQYPSYYGLNQNVRIHPDLRIKPFLFLLALMQDADIQYLENLEIIFPVVYGHNWECFELCKEKILAFRQDGSGDVLKFIDNPDEDFYTPRAAYNSRSLGNMQDIANTAKNYLEAVALVESETINRTQRISINSDFSGIINEALKQKNSFIANPSQNLSFQRSYGAWNRTKDTTKEVQPKKKTKGESFILTHFMEYVGENLVIDNADDFVQRMAKQFGFKSHDVKAVIDPYLDKALSFFETKYIELSKGGTATATDFEKATVQLLRDRLGIDAEHIGSKRKKAGVGAYTDVIAERATDNVCGLIDTKASSAYNIPSTDYAKMVSNYIPNYRDVAKPESQLQFVSYVAGGFSGEVNSKLKNLFSDTKVPASAVSAKVLIDASRRPGIAAKSKQIWEVFRKNKMLTDEDFNL